MSARSIKCFISYSHNDKAMFEKFSEQIACLERIMNIEQWYDGMIPAGGNIDDEIREQLSVADVVFLLISPSYIKSYYCYEKELAAAIERHEEDKCKVIPVIIKKYPPGEYPFSKLKYVPTDGRSVSNFRSHNDGFVDALVGIKSLLQDLVVEKDRESDVSEDDRKEKTGKSKIVNKDSEIRYPIVNGGKVINRKLTSSVFKSIIDYNSNLIKFSTEMNNLTKESLDELKKETTRSSPIKNVKYRRNLEDFMLQMCGYMQLLFIGQDDTCIHFRRNEGDLYYDFLEMGYSKNKLSTNPISARYGMIECAKINRMPVIKNYNKILHERSHPEEKVKRNYITFAFNNISDCYNIDLSMCVSRIGSKKTSDNNIFVAMSIMRLDLLIEKYIIQYIENCKEIDPKYDVYSIFKN